MFRRPEDTSSYTQRWIAVVAGVVGVTLASSGGVSADSPDEARNVIEGATIEMVETDDRATTQPGSITVAHEVSDEPDSSDLVEFGYSGDLGAFVLVDDPTDPSRSTKVVSELAAGRYSVIRDETGTPGFELESIDCGDAALIEPAPVGGVTIDLHGDQDVQCTFTHRATGALTISTSVRSAPALLPGHSAVTVAYDLVISNADASQTSYTLTDSLEFGDGATATAIAVTGPGGAAIAIGPAADDVYTIVSDDLIEAATTESYVVTVTFSVDPQMPVDERTCDNSTAGRGASNSATVTFGAGSATDDACADIPGTGGADLAIVKTASADIVDQGRAMSYELVVTNNGPADATEVVVTDDAPEEVDVFAVVSNDFACTFADNVVVCTRPSLAAGASGTIMVEAIVNAGVTGTVSNTATITGEEPDPDPGNDFSTASIEVPEVAVDPPQQPPLPETGSRVDHLVAVASILLMGGCALLLAATRRRAHLA